MTYLLVGEAFVLLLLMAAKLWRMPQLSQNDRSTLLERWSVNFSFEIVNRFLAFIIGALLLPYVQLATRPVTWISFVLYILILDFCFYWRHRIYHRWFWSFHRAHHSDTGYDFTLSLRIHPIETILQIGFFVLVSKVLHVNQWQMFLAAHIFTLQALISHVDYHQPNTLFFKFLQKIFVVSPSHRFHHDDKNPNRNFGFLFSFWDTIFGTHEKGTRNESN